MRTCFMKYCCIFVMLITAFSCSDDDSAVASPNNLSVTDEILKLINEHRASEGLSPLEVNATAERLAIEHTEYMIAEADISHDNFQARSNELNQNENASSTAENVASFYPNAASVVEGWLNSTGHRNNIEGNFTHTGIAALQDENGNYYYTQLFYR